MSEPIRLQRMGLELAGNRLIEASAGTGKTYTLAALYLRLILGLGPQAAFRGGQQPLSPKDILVLTFTRAATSELRSRIRSRLVEVAQLLRQALEATGQGQQAFEALCEQQTDNFLQELLAYVAYQALTAEQLSSLEKRCTNAANEMDLAAIYTLHSFCQRALKRFSFAVGIPFEQQLLPEDGQLKTDIANDYWRTYIQPQHRLVCVELAKAKLDTPAKLIKDTDKLEPADAIEQFPREIADYVPQLREQEAARKKAQQLFVEQRQSLEDWIAEMIDQKRLNANYSKKTRRNALYDFCDGSHKTKNLNFYTVEGLAWNKNKQQDIPTNLTCLAAMGDYLEQAAAVGELPLDALKSHACGWMHRELLQRLEQQSKVTYTTMVSHLDDALLREANSDQQPLANQLFQAYPCTLIDEFQDTDKRQYRIFQHIYAYREQSSYAWLMIGDPKQAIYGFRGADIKVYEAARKTVAESYALDTNFRSSGRMVEACNALFLTSPLRPRNGEEGTNGEPGPVGVFGSEAIRYQRVQANQGESSLRVEAGAVSALTICHLLPKDAAPKSPSGLCNKGQAEACLSAHFASRIAQLLDGARRGQVGFGQPDGCKKPLRPSDIACLVRSGSQADALKKALKRQGVDSVFMSEKNSVYQSATATDLFALLTALAQPQDTRLVRQALATDLLDYNQGDASLLVEQLKGENLQQQLLSFRQLHQLWQRHGVLAMLHRLVHQFELPKRQRDERVLTNLFHLAELLQRESVSLDGMAALLGYFEQAIMDEDKDGEDNAEIIMRLENERDRVIIMTLHGAKGLEFPLVMLPFSSLIMNPKKDEEAVNFNEELRLLYVGITRAVHACWLGLVFNVSGGPGKNASLDSHRLEKSPLGQLLFGDQHCTSAVVYQRLQQLVEASNGSIHCDNTLEFTRDNEANSDYGYQPPALAPLQPANASLPIRQPHYWTVTSYSGLTRFTEQSVFSANTERLVTDHDMPETDEERQASSAIHGFAKGAETGNLLHGLLETCCQRGFNRLDSNAIKWLVAQTLAYRQMSESTALIASWIERLIHTPLPFDQQQTALANTSVTLAETEFWLRMKHTGLEPLDALAQQFLPGPRALLKPRQIDGMLKGFIDLLFEVDGRYYVLDYKSNWLGATDAAYTQDNMTAAMLSHRYELQGLLYQLALHRLLAQRLGDDYDPQQQLGGCLFFFLRGIGSESRGVRYLAADIELIAELDQLFEGEQP